MATVITPTRHRLSVEDFRRMVSTGILQADERIELIAGELIDMAPIGSEHAGTVYWLGQRLALAIGETALVGSQNPLQIDEHSQTQPDVLVLRLRPDFYRQNHPRPTDVLLLIEVADSSIRFDRDIKAPLYARHGIPEMWLVDLQQRCVEVYRDPDPEAGQYRSKTSHRQGQLVAERLALAAIDVEKLF